MAFGFSVGDFVKTIELTTTVVKAYRNGPREYAEIRAEAKALRMTLQSLSDDAADERSLLNSAGTVRRQELLGLLAGCENVLGQANNIVQKHSKLEQDRKTRRWQRVWHTYRAGRTEVGVITQRMTFHVACITAFNQSLQGSGFAKAIRQIDHIYNAMVREGALERFEDNASSVSIAETVRSRLDTDEDGVWEELKQELASQHVSMTALAAYRSDVIAYLKQKLDLDENFTQNKEDGLQDVSPLSPLSPSEDSLSAIRTDHQQRRYGTDLTATRNLFGPYMHNLIVPEKHCQSFEIISLVKGMLPHGREGFGIFFRVAIGGFQKLNQAKCNMRLALFSREREGTAADWTPLRVYKRIHRCSPEWETSPLQSSVSRFGGGKVISSEWKKNHQDPPKGSSFLLLWHNGPWTTERQVVDFITGGKFQLS